MIARLIRWSATNLMLDPDRDGLRDRSRPLCRRPRSRSTPFPISRTRRSSSTRSTRARRRRWSRIRSPIPLSTAMLSVPRSKVVRGFSFFGVSFVYVIFEEGTDIYWARSRVLEYLSGATRTLPQGVMPTLGPDATGVGWVYQYAVMAQEAQPRRTAHDAGLAGALRRRQGGRRRRGRERRRLRAPVFRRRRSAPPARLRHSARPRSASAIRESNMDVGGRVVELAETEFMVRGRGYLKSIADIESIVLKAQGGTPVLHQGRGARRAGARRAARRHRTQRRRRGRLRHRHPALRPECAVGHRQHQGALGRDRRQPARRAPRSCPSTIALT